MKKTNIIIISLCLSIFILPSIVHADVIAPGASSEVALLFLIIIVVIIGLIALIAWIVIRKIKKYYDSKSKQKHS